ncbi:guanylate kinase [Thermoclostridium caenicola]|uniref:Guanylate kinase n=1 Tax=Thermoclostridium caenicola TaxID=659425 RepID=A0A1M6B901_9FIRM|nr:guanylate kinase [Thermoclostridium caenicola]SHI45219.1 guanylate kinase [Thermoclostridium caenicola]
MNPGLLIVVSGPAGVGKGSVIKRAMELTDNLAMSVSATSRKPRPGEIDGVHYFFRTREQFETMIAEQRLVEWVEYCGNYYGTPREYVTRELEKGRNIILEIEVEGSMKIKEMFRDSILCFIVPPSYEELARRLRSRNTEDEETIQRRLKRALEEFQYIDRYDYVVLNDSIEEAAQRFVSIVRAEEMRTFRNKALIDQLKVRE